MTRMKRGMAKHAHHKKVLKLTKGYRASNSKLFRIANQQLMHSMAYAFAHRRKKKGDFRKLWIVRINAAARMNGLTYNRLMDGLKKAGVTVNRKILADLAVNDMAAFDSFVKIAKENIQ